MKETYSKNLQQQQTYEYQQIQNQNQTIQIKTRYKEYIYLIFLGILSNILFFYHKRDCPYTREQDCLKKFIIPNLYTWILSLAFSVIIFIFSFKKSYSNRNYLLFAIQILNVSYILFSPNEKIITMTRYNGGFRLFFLVFAIIFTLIYILSKICINLSKKYKEKFVIPFVCILFTFIIVIYNKKIINSCEKWDKGAVTNVIQNEQLCKLQIPNYCWYDILDGFMDLSRFTPECQIRDYEFDQNLYQKHFKNYFQGAKYMGYPLVNNFTEQQLQTNIGAKYTIQQEILNNTIFYENIQEAKKYHEIIIDIYNQTVINNIIKRTVNNNTQNTPEKNQKNLYIIYIDALSRPGAHRKLPKTIEYLSKKRDNFFEFFRYHATQPSTEDNILQLLYNTVNPFRDYGKKHFERNKKRKFPLENIFKKIKNQKGNWVTGHSSNFCQLKVFQQDDWFSPYFIDSPLDHEGFQLSCDPNFQNPDNVYNPFQGPYSMLRRCYYQKNSYQHVMDYAEQFVNTYQQQNKAIYLEFMDAHEGSGEVISYIDEDMLKFLEKIDNQENTDIILVSDHGLHMQGLLYVLKLDVVSLEIALPTFMLRISDNTQKESKENGSYQTLLENQQKFIKMSNIHNTILELSGIEINNPKEEETWEYKESQKSVFQEISEERNCQNSGIFLKKTRCACKSAN